MSVFIRLTMSCVVIVGLFGGLTFAQPEWATGLGLDFWRFPQLTRALANEQKRSEALAERQKAFRERSAAKNQILRALNDRKIDLSTAIHRIAGISDGWFMKHGMLTVPVKGETETDRFCRSVIYWAKTQYKNQPRRAKDIEKRLLREYRQVSDTIDL